MVKTKTRNIALIFTMLLLGGIVNEAWAAGYKVTYHILTLPINPSRYDYHMKDNFTGKRLEAFRYVENNATTIKLPDIYKSPLATNFKYYYDGDNIVKTAAAQLYSDNTATKSWSYSITDENAVVEENTALKSDRDIYVTYDYDETKDIKLDGSVNYNITMSGGFMALNRGRNNRLAVIPENLVNSEQLASEDFVYVDVSSVKDITTYWANNNKNKRADVESQFLFLFKYEGRDPYNIVIASAYDKNTTYIEKHNDRESQLYKWYKDSHLFGKNTTSDNLFLASDDHKRYTTEYNQNLSSNPTEIESDSKPGYFHTMWDNVIWNSYALLNSTTTGGYVYMVTRTVNGSGNISAPSDNKYTFLRHEKNNNVRFGTMTLGSASTSYSSDEEMYDIRTYSFKVKTPFNNIISVDKEWSDASLSQSIMEHYPEGLKRKYVNIEGFYSDQAFTNPVTTFDEAKSRCTLEGGKYNIYVKYSTTSLPFTALAAGGSYTNATWYELTDAESDGGKKIKWNSTVFQNNGASGVYEKESEFAFIGDPYELRIICRKQTTENTANYYVGCADPSTSTNLDVNASDASAHYKWEIPYDDTSGSFTLREMNSTNACWQWDTSSLGNNITYSTTASTRIKLMTIGKLSYTFKVVDLAGNIAIQATAEATPFAPLTGTGVGYSMIPAAIRSPYIADETITFYSTYSGGGRGNLSGVLTELPGTDESIIFVKYTTERLSSKSITLGQTQSFNVKLNGEYIYWDSSTGKVMSNASATASNLTENPYLWRLRGRDPYAMIIDNIGATANAYNGSFTDNETVTIYADDGTTTSESRYKGAWVKTSNETWDDDKALAFDTDRTHAARFIAMLGNYAGVYEVMAATGNDTYYHIGRASEENAEVKMYSTSTYAHGADELRFVLESTTLIQYHLIDKSGKEIFRNEISSRNARLALPAEYVSPLVANYHYYAGTDVDQANGADGTLNTADDIFSLKSSPTDLSEAGGNSNIYVFYDVSNEIGFGDRHPHMLKFWNGKSYKLEDGNDNLTTGAKIKAMYPYCNGDGSLNVYGEAMNEEQMAGGSSTRPRWVWYFESANNDPYHVKIHSKSTISFGGRSNTTYLQTFAVHFNQETDAPNKQRIVTGGNLIGITQDKATEYAILGIKNKYKLLTIDPVAADLNGNGNKTNDGENERRYVTSFEQYWKTYNMIKKCVLGINVNDKDEPYHNDFSDDRSTFEMPSELWPTLKTKLGSGTGNFDINDPNDLNYVDDCSWHSYDAVAYAVRWNGYNDVEGSSGYEKKKVERLEHWFQTFDMGDGTFDIEDADIPPVLILLDRHGWEIMRKPIPMGDGDADPSAAEKLAALRVYDSPMVKEYKFYSTAQKVSNCHKFHLRMQNGSERDPIKVGGTQFTSTSLAVLPPYVVDRDLYVTYTVKEEYEKSYRYSLEYTTGKDENNKTTYNITSETGTPSAFIVLQNHQYASDNSSTLTAMTAPSNLSNEIISDAAKSEGSKTFNQDALWYLQPNLEIDDEMGIPWPWSLAASADDPHYQAETKVTFKDKTGFDPYNLQLKNVSTNKFFTIDMKKSVLEGGQYNGDYTGGTTNVTLAAACTSPISSPESYDHSTLKMTNQTFMVVQDVNGNMQLMPRFDHSRRINAFVSLANPLTQATKADVDDASPGAQTTFLVRPQVFDYRILDNDGNVAMHYQTAGESYPSIPEHFKSPLAKDFKFFFGHAAYTTAGSTKETYDAAEEASKKIATDEGDMNAQVMDLDRGDYYFKIGSDTYKKVTVTNSKTSTTSNGIYDDVKEERDISGREITSSFAAAGVQTNADIFIRYIYDKASDSDYDNILRGRWMTMSLGGKDVQASGTLNTSDGSGVSLYKGTKNVSESKWQWKFLQSPTVSTSTYYKAPDPYAVRISNREANNDTPTANPSKMSVAIKVGGTDRFVILNHPSGGYALAAAGNGLSYSFLNGGSMTEPSTTPASVELEADFKTTTNTISNDAQVIFTNDVTHTYTYNVITNDKLLAAYASQDDEAANVNGYIPILPENIQSQLIYLDDYLYYGTVTIDDKGNGAGSDDEYTIDTESQIDDLYGLYDDVVYVRYPTFSRDNTPYLVPNARNDASPVAVGFSSNDVAIDISGNLPYDIIWLDDNMMVSSDGNTITNGGDKSHALSATSTDMWRFEGGDPYAIKIRRDGISKYVNGTATLVDEGSAKTFMLLKKEGYDYGVLAETGNQGTFLSEYGQTMVTGGTAPTKFIPFALSVYHLIYHLVIAKTCPDQENTQSGEYVDIPYRDGDETTYQTSGTFDADNDKKTIYGSTQRDLTSKNDGDGDHVAGEKYQLGETINGQTYSHDAGKVSLGDELDVPACFYRPNVLYSYYVEGVYDNLECTTPNNDLNNKYKGLKVTKLMSDADLIGKTVRVNITYGFLTGLETNSGGDFVTSVSQNKWYTFEAKASTPKLAQYTGSLQTVSGYATHYTNDYLWTPLGDPYGFKMYNRYMHKNLGEESTVMTTASAPSEGINIEMRSDNDANSVYELLAEKSKADGYFLVHPVVNTDVTKYYMHINEGDGTLELSTTATEWTYGLSEDVMRPYYEGTGNVGGLNAAGKAAYETEAKKTNPLERLMGIQDVVYNHDNDGSDPNNPNYIVHYAPGYYRLHNQPGSKGISTLRYASGYLHDIEKTAGESSTAIPMHFYSRVGVNTTFEGEETTNLNTGFTKTAATQGAIPVPATEYDPSTIFYFSGSSGSINISTQGLNVKENKMTTSTGTAYTITDIGGGVVALSGASSNYLRYDQSDAEHIYDLTYDATGDESARWCMEPSNKQGLMIKTNDGGDGYFYATFYAPFDVQLPAKDGSTEYLAYICTAWDPQAVHPTMVPAVDTYLEGKFVPASTPVIIRTTDNTGQIKLTLPKNSPTDALSCVFSGEYLEQLLSRETLADNDKVYTFGLPISGYGSMTMTTGTGNGAVTDIVGRDQAKNGVGFFVNATPNKELGDNTGLWTPNNRYILHNKIYYRASGGGGAPHRAIEFIPVIFDNDSDEEIGDETEKKQRVGDGCIYDLMGRRVATKEQVEDGSWRTRLAPGIYILNGRKFKK